MILVISLTCGACVATGGRMTACSAAKPGVAGRDSTAVPAPGVPVPDHGAGLINTVAEAIARAELEPKVAAFKAQWATAGQVVGSHGKLKSDSQTWIVVFYVDEIRDVFLEVQVSREGEIIHMQEGEE